MTYRTTFEIYPGLVCLSRSSYLKMSISSPIFAQFQNVGVENIVYIFIIGTPRVSQLTEKLKFLKTIESSMISRVQRHSWKTYPG